ncbi:MAG TPA: glycine betaine ABC transporter substrate-binding protein [Steroidobacteraceae bacterium]|nr:glycine betaine ABC transporter substrate-binding protein [Steroidobacteraceae bacterium]
MLASGVAGSARADAVIVGSKIDTEGALLGNIIILRLEQGGIAVESRIGLGPTNIVRAAILAGAIDIYPEYTGNGARFFHSEGDAMWKNAAQGYATVARLDRAKNGLVWLAPAPANNTWAIAVPKVLAARIGATLEGFARYVTGGGRVRLAASAEFVEDPLGLPAIEAAYHFTLTQNQLLVLAGGDTSATIRAAAEGISGVNAAMAYGTDGALAALGLGVLADDKGAEIVYEPAPVVRQQTLAAHPEIPRLLDPVFRSLTRERLQQLNAAIAVDGDAARDVAARYLASGGFAK